MTTIAALYARVSTPNQEEEATIDSQVASIERYIGKQGYALSADNYYLDKAVSGAQLERPALDRLRHVASDGLIAVVVCYSPDRLSRNYAHQLVLLDELRRNGVNVEFVNQPTLGDNPQAQLLMGIQGLFAEYERAMIKERMRLGRLHKLRTGQAMHPQTPYGYRYVPVSEPGGGQWVIDEIEAETVRQIFAWYTGEEAVTMYAIVERLNQTHRHALRKAQKWQFSIVRNILQHTAYIGHTYFNSERYNTEAIGQPRKNGRGLRRTAKSEKRPREEWIEAKTPSIIEESVWHEAQSRVKMNQQFAKRNNSKNFYLLRGLVVCQTCGYTMQGHTQNGRMYYFCARGGRTRYENVPHHINRQKGELLEELVWKAIADLLRNPAQIAVVWDANEQSSDKPTVELDRLQKRQKSLDLQWTRLLDLYQDALIAKDELSQRKVNLDAERQTIANRIDEIQRMQARLATQAQLIADFEAFCANAEKMLENPPKETQQEVLRLLVEKIIVADDEIIIKHIIPHDDNYRLIPRDNMQTRPICNAQVHKPVGRCCHQHGRGGTGLAKWLR